MKTVGSHLASLHAGESRLRRQILPFLFVRLVYAPWLEQRNRAHIHEMRSVPDLLVLGEGVDLFRVPLPPSLADRALVQAEIGARTRLNVIARQEDGRIVTNPPADRRLAPESVLVARGSAERRQRFSAVFE